MTSISRSHSDVQHPQVTDPHIQATIDALWRSEASPDFVAAVLARYVDREPALKPVIAALRTDSDAPTNFLNSSTTPNESYDWVGVYALLGPVPTDPATKATIQAENDRLRQAEAERHVQQDGAQVLAERRAAFARIRRPPFARIKPPIQPIRFVPTPVDTVRVDPELARLALGLHKIAEFRVWATARHHFGDPGWVYKDELLERLQTDGVIRTRRHYNRLLKAGAGPLWGLADDGRVWLRSVRKVAWSLTSLAMRTKPQLIATNRPGVADVYVRVAGEIGDFRAQVYAAWLTHRQDPTIARETLCTLFNVTEDTLRNWEKRLGEQVTVIFNYAQTVRDPKEDPELLHYLPERCYSYVTRRGEMHLRWRMSNTYRTASMRQHSHKGQARKVRVAAALAVLDQPVESRARGLEVTLAHDRSHWIPKRYFASETTLESLIKRMVLRDQVAITPETPRYVLCGFDHNEHGIYELSLDGKVYTSAYERMPIKAEYRWWAGYRAMIEQKRKQAQGS